MVKHEGRTARRLVHLWVQWMNEELRVRDSPQCQMPGDPISLHPVLAYDNGRIRSRTQLMRKPRWLRTAVVWEVHSCQQILLAVLHLSPRHSSASPRLYPLSAQEQRCTRFSYQRSSCGKIAPQARSFPWMYMGLTGATNRHECRKPRSHPGSSDHPNRRRDR